MLRFTFASYVSALMISERSTPVASFIDSNSFAITTGTLPATEPMPLPSLPPPMIVILSIWLSGSAIFPAISGRTLIIISAIAALL